jgi:predicted ABC-class ATPase
MKRLQSLLTSLDGKGYKAYKDLKGSYDFPDFRLIVDHVQGDPYAAPSRLRAVVPHATAALPAHAYSGEPRQRAARDYIARGFRRAARDISDIAIDAGAQTVLDRSCTVFTDGGIELRFSVNLPAKGRSIMGRRAAQLLTEELPRVIRACAMADAIDGKALQRYCDAVEDQVALRAQLDAAGLVGFVADHAVLPRRSGVDDRPLQDAIPFQAPPQRRVTLQAPNAGAITGLGIPRGITLIVGGGFHGKSTLLTALERGVYDHVPGDGRDRIVASDDAAKIRAEDGRAVHAMDLSPFINHLPYAKSTEDFGTDLASGSTSQAAALQEALEAGVSTLLVDEDTSATNFMIRDERMQRLVAKRDEPITPFVDRIAELRDRLGVSTILVMGGSGDYFQHADTVIQMQDYLPHDVTDEARRIAAEHGTRRQAEAETVLDRPKPRRLAAPSVDATTGKGKTKIKARGCEALVFGNDDIDLRAVEQLVDTSQVRAIGTLLAQLGEAGASASDPVTWLQDQLSDEVLARIVPRPEGDLARPRHIEVMAALNRLRSARFQPVGKG